MNFFGEIFFKITIVKSNKMRIIFLFILLIFPQSLIADLSPDGNKIVHTLNVKGSSKIFITLLDGSNSKQISKEQGNYYNPIWSPSGNKIAFEKKEGNKHYIGVMDANGLNERMIALEFNVESPFWSKDGKKIYYNVLDKFNNIKLFRVDISGYNLKLIIK